MLYQNQYNAVKCCEENNFANGVIHHATGTGKSITGISIIKKYLEKSIEKNVYWICEHKFIIDTIFTNNKFNEEFAIIKETHDIFNFSKDKNKYWTDLINNSKKYVFVIINRAYLVTNKKYEKIEKNIDLIIHDECHSIQNETTRLFYDYLNSNHTFRAIGLSATPSLNYFPFKDVIHSYTLYQAFIDNNIVTPKIVWFNKDTMLSFREIAIEVKSLIQDLLYKKIVVWCGLIDVCIDLFNMWKEYYPEYTICIDTSKNIETENNYEKFKNLREKGFLFCAAKHREGSDIKNLDGCIFLDKVSKRTPKTFMQCVGRVLRKEENKKYGLIVDVKAKNAYEIVKRLSQYLNNSNNFPFDYTCSITNNIKTNVLKILKEQPKTSLSENDANDANHEKDEIKQKFKRPIPQSKEYLERLDFEINLFIEKDLLKYLYFAIEILELTQDIPHVTRGSCGSSLTCYLLGITKVDPIKYNIKFERFLNRYRNNLPDIDFDFPHILRDDIFYRLEKKWPGKIARISNHVHFHEKSAKRAVLKEMGHNNFIGKYEINDVIKELDSEKRKEFENRVKKLENTFRLYSLHCGGIVFYPEGVPDYLKLVEKSSKVINQITLNKYDIADDKKFKIDILSSRGISQLMDVNTELAFKDFSDIVLDEKVMQIFQKGENIGITLAESPLIRKAMVKKQPKNIEDLAIVLSIIRPAAKDAKDAKDANMEFIEALIFDDDAIDLISKYSGVDLETADYYRRNFIKNNDSVIEEMYSNCSSKNRILLAEKIENLHGYSFCKAHAFSYAELIYKLAYIKYYNPKRFWISTLKNNDSSYKKWVHIYEASIYNVNYFDKDKDTSVYSANKLKNIEEIENDEFFEKFGVWNITKSSLFYPGCYGYLKNNNYYFKGLIAQSKLVGNTMIYFIGVGTKKYIEIVIKKFYFMKDTSKKKGIYGAGTLADDSTIIINARYFKYF